MLSRVLGEHATFSWEGTFPKGREFLCMSSMLCSYSSPGVPFCMHLKYRVHDQSILIYKRTLM